MRGISFKEIPAAEALEALRGSPTTVRLAPNVVVREINFVTQHKPQIEVTSFCDTVATFTGGLVHTDVRLLLELEGSWSHTSDIYDAIHQAMGDGSGDRNLLGIDFERDGSRYRGTIAVATVSMSYQPVWPATMVEIKGAAVGVFTVEDAEEPQPPPGRAISLSGIR